MLRARLGESLGKDAWLEAHDADTTDARPRRAEGPAPPGVGPMAKVASGSMVELTSAPLRMPPGIRLGRRFLVNRVVVVVGAAGLAVLSIGPALADGNGAQKATLVPASMPMMMNNCKRMPMPTSQNGFNIFNLAGKPG